MDDNNSDRFSTHLTNVSNLNEALQNFFQSSGKVIQPELLEILSQIAQTGLTCFPWQPLHMLLQTRFKQVFENFPSAISLSSGDLGQVEQIDFQKKQNRLKEQQNSFFQSLASFSNAPFTIQRLCELALHPEFYKSFDKYLFALQKLLTITSTLRPLNPIEYNEAVSMLQSQKQSNVFLNKIEQLQVPKPERLSVTSPVPFETGNSIIIMDTTNQSETVYNSNINSSPEFPREDSHKNNGEGLFSGERRTTREMYNEEEEKGSVDSLDDSKEYPMDMEI